MCLAKIVFLVLITSVFFSDVWVNVSSFSSSLGVVFNVVFVILAQVWYSVSGRYQSNVDFVIRRVYINNINN